PYLQAKLGEGGGLMGFYISDFLKSAVEGLGAFLILLASFLFSLTLTLNTSLDNLLKFVVRILGFINDNFTARLKAFVTGSRFVKRKALLEEEPAEEGGEEKDQAEEEFVTVVLSPPSAPAAIDVSVPSTALSTAQLKEETISNLPGKDYIWEYPPLTLLSAESGTEAIRGDVNLNAQRIEDTLQSFGVKARVVEVNKGPAVTQYALEIAKGTKITKITNLANDLALALAAPTGAVRIEAPIPGRSLIGIEVPNQAGAIVNLRGIMESKAMRETASKLAVALGLDVSGNSVVSSIDKMPHILVAGSTGSGKSVLLHSFITTLLFRNSPQELKLILIDPKRVELPQYTGIPHLLTPVIVEPEKSLPSLKWAIAEMDRRYRLFENSKVRNIKGYNDSLGFQALPYIVIVVDELADLMMIAPSDVERSICRLAQMSRATGIHLVLATQRPSVDVLTGLIKANIPARIAFNVTSQVDSRVIIDQVGAEKLLGRGDMLYVPPDASKPMRLQGAYVTDKEIHHLIDFLKKSEVEPEYEEDVTTYKIEETAGMSGGSRDELFEEAVNIVCSHDKASSSLLQRRLRVGYARAARLLDELEFAGVVSVKDGSKPRDVLITDPAQVLGEEESEEE
ncbi:MAG: DNA translocase FtsK, partial [bacterium]